MPEDVAEGYINGELLDALKEKPRFTLAEGEQFPEVWVGVDPLSHGRSEMGLAAIAYSTRGEKVILGTAAVPTLRPMLVEVAEAVRVFLDRIRNHPGCGLSVLVPIVEWSVPPARSPGPPRPRPALTPRPTHQQQQRSLQPRNRPRVRRVSAAEQPVEQGSLRQKHCPERRRLQ